MVAIMPCFFHIILIHVSQLLADMILIRYLDIHFLNFLNVTGAIDWTEEVYPIKTSNLTSGFRDVHPVLLIVFVLPSCLSMYCCYFVSR